MLDSTVGHVASCGVVAFVFVFGFAAGFGVWLAVPV